MKAHGLYFGKTRVSQVFVFGFERDRVLEMLFPYGSDKRF